MAVCPDPLPTIDSYSVERWLGERAVAAVDDAGRRVVLKRVPDDCLSGERLHTAVAERLARVRELAHAQVAHLIAVERAADGSAWAAWRFVEGTPIDLTPIDNVARRRAACRELLSAVDLLHARGIVHGAIKPGNVIVTPAGRMILTHVSPLLFTDPADDVTAVRRVVESIVPSLGAGLGDVSTIAAIDAAVVGDNPAPDALSSARSRSSAIEPTRIRRDTVLAAVLVVLAGAGLAAALYAITT